MSVTRAEKITRLTAAVQRMQQETDVEALARGPAAAEGYESFDTGAAADSGLQKLLAGRGDQLTDAELLAQEAIVMPTGRPAALIRGGVYTRLEAPWQHLNAAAVRGRVQPLFAAVGRVELPTNDRLPFAGTGFVVGPGLLMTNRHVAALFTSGVGNRGLVYRAGDAAVHFGRQAGDPSPDPARPLDVRQVLMVHPHWDMALLRVDGLDGITPLRLSVDPPANLSGRDVAAVGYPAFDTRNDAAVQTRIFGGVFEVKRFMPGKLRERADIRSFETVVSAVTHDGSTLGGASGSAVFDLTSGLVVGLHFAGVYLKANYAVPAAELARDPRVVAAGVNFAGTVPPTAAYDAAWRRVGSEGPVAAVPPVPLTSSPPVYGSATATFTLPLHISVTVGSIGPVAALPPPDPYSPPDAAPPVAPVEAMKVPVIAPGLDTRDGYQADFLGLADGDPVPLPELTAAGKRVAAKLDDGGVELKYHHFSVLMHKKRRLALYCAANVDWRPASRTVNGRRFTRQELSELGANDIEKWVPDPRLAGDFQLPDVFFTKDGGAFDKGHLIRRDDVAYGTSFADIQMANGDTYHTTNCSPQVSGFNQSARGVDNWGDLENMVQKETRAEKVCVFAGPVFAADDPVFVGRGDHGEVRLTVPRK